MASGTSCRLAVRFSAVTTISARPEPSSAAVGEFSAAACACATAGIAPNATPANNQEIFCIPRLSRRQRSCWSIIGATGPLMRPPAMYGEMPVRHPPGPLLEVFYILVYNHISNIYGLTRKVVGSACARGFPHPSYSPLSLWQDGTRSPERFRVSLTSQLWNIFFYYYRIN